MYLQFVPGLSPPLQTEMFSSLYLKSTWIHFQTLTAARLLILPETHNLINNFLFFWRHLSIIFYYLLLTKMLLEVLRFFSYLHRKWGVTWNQWHYIWHENRDNWVPEVLTAQSLEWMLHATQTDLFRLFFLFTTTDVRCVDRKTFRFEVNCCGEASQTSCCLTSASLANTHK